MFYQYKINENAQSAYLQGVQEEQEAERIAKQEAEAAAEEAAELALQEDTESSSFYQKLSKGYDVNILIVGDSIGATSGASATEYRWTTLLDSYLTEQYGSNVTITNVSMGGNASYAGYSRVMMLDDGTDYDLSIICYGQNDSTTDFSLYYETIIRAISSKYEKCSIISILESSQKTYTEKMVTIQEICDYYGIPIADTIAPFSENYDSYTDDSVHPNDAGQAIYAETVESVIDNMVEADTGFNDYNLTPINVGATAFDNFRYISADEFERTDEVTYTITGLSISGILGIDYSYQSGDNLTEIYVDGELFVAPTVTFNYDFSQRHILIVSNDFTVENEIKIVFSSSELADEFNGIIFSWE
ncbi:MAG: SGNH/GDSL hydrolase family protein [Oscillospiraceae bacterium]|nr:SGNH/GDSL hydrolase family protein [Oscillospiraceae bacterium]